MKEDDEILTIKGVNKKFGGIQAIKDLNLSIKEGKITGLIGPNGAGKTTCFNLVNGIFPVDSGEVRFLGKLITGMVPYQIAQLGICRTFQTLNNFPRLSLYENIRAGILSKFLHKQVEDKRVQDILALLRISHLAEKEISEVPPVVRRLVEVGRSLIAEPKLVLFDEIMAGFNEEEIVSLIEVIRKANQQGITFCIIGHTMRAIMDVSDWVVVLDEGSKFVEGAPPEIQKNKEVQRIYLGG